MPLPSREPIPHELPRRATPGGARQEEGFGSVAGGRRALAAFLATLAGLGYPPGVRDRVRQALGPAVLAALRCSWGEGRASSCTFRHLVREEYVLAEIEGTSHGPGGPPGQGPHGAHLLQPVGAAPFWARSYTWVRCDRRDGRVSVCTFHSAP